MSRYAGCAKPSSGLCCSSQDRGGVIKPHPDVLLPLPTRPSCTDHCRTDQNRQNSADALQVKYKEVMKQYGLGPNGGILTSLNLFATRFDQVRWF